MGLPITGQVNVFAVMYFLDVLTRQLLQDYNLSALAFYLGEARFHWEIWDQMSY